MKGIAAILFLFLAIPFSKSEAGIFLEPQVGYSFGTYGGESDDPDVSVLDSTVDGMSFGAKAGLEMGYFQVAAEYLQSNVTDEDNDKDTFKDMSAILGLRFDWFRLYGGYIFSAKTDDIDNGSGTKFGVTFYALSWLAISAEYRAIEYDSVTLDGVKFDMDYKAAALLLSFPINF